MPRKRAPRAIKNFLPSSAAGLRSLGRTRKRNGLRSFLPRGAAALQRAFGSSSKTSRRSLGHRTHRGGRRGRKPGTKVRYTDYQTRRYQSLWLRSERARRLIPPTRLEDDVWQFRSRRKRVLPYRTTTKDSLTPVASFPGSVTRSGNPPSCPEPATLVTYQNPLFKWTANGIHDCAQDVSSGGGGTTGGGGNSGGSTPAAGNCPGSLYRPPAGQSANAVYAYWNDGRDGISHPGIPFPLDFNWGCGTHTLSSPSAYPFYTSSSNGGIQFLYYRIPDFSEEVLIVAALWFTSYSAANLPLTYPDDSPWTLIENYQAGTEFFCEGNNADPNRGFCYPAGSGGGGDIGGGGGGGGGSPPGTGLATAGGEWASNTFTVPERLDILTAIAYSVVKGMPTPTGAIALRLFDNGAETMALTSTPVSAGARSVNRPMTLLPDHTYQFKISIPETIYCDAAIVRLGGKYVCNCPDWNRRSKAFPSKYPSELGDRNWSQSSAGTRSDCKHIIYLKLLTGEPIDLQPDDLRDIRQFRRDGLKLQRQLRKRERQAERQGMRDARKRVKQDLRGMKRRDKAELKQLTANRDYKTRGRRNGGGYSYGGSDPGNSY